MLHRAYVGLGSNLPSLAGTPVDTIRAALERLNSFGVIQKQSGLYRTLPVSNVKQPPFLNAVAELETDLEPEQLLEALLQIEKEYGRDRSAVPLKGPRTLDLDLLLVDNLQMATPKLILPHPEMANRRFVLAPLAEIAPLLEHPALEKNIETLLAQLPLEGENGPDAVNRL